MVKIIVQETDAGILDVLSIALKEENFEVYAIQEFDDDFMTVVDNLRPHVIILDYRLKGDRAVKILTEIKKKYKHLPIIAISCNCNINTISIEKGFDDYIKKPFDLDRMFSILRRQIPKLV